MIQHESEQFQCNRWVVQASSKTGVQNQAKPIHGNVLPTAGMHADYTVSESKIRITQNTYGNCHPTFNRGILIMGNINPTCISLKPRFSFLGQKISFPRSQASCICGTPCFAVAEISLAKCTNPCGKKRLRFSRSKPDASKNNAWYRSRTWNGHTNIHQTMEEVCTTSPSKECSEAPMLMPLKSAWRLCHLPQNVRLSINRHLPKGPPCMRAATSDVRLQWSTTIRV